MIHFGAGDPNCLVKGDWVMNNKKVAGINWEEEEINEKGLFADIATGGLDGAGFWNVWCVGINPRQIYHGSL
jgi:hypothetical protein